MSLDRMILSRFRSFLIIREQYQKSEDFSLSRCFNSFLKNFLIWGFKDCLLIAFFLVRVQTGPSVDTPVGGARFILSFICRVYFVSFLAASPRLSLLEAVHLSLWFLPWSRDTHSERVKTVLF